MVVVVEGACCCVPRAIDYKVLKALNTGSSLYFASLFPSPSPFLFFLIPSSEGAEGANAVFFSVSGHVGVVHV